MFGWLRPKSPLNASEKAWTETRMHRLVAHVGCETWLHQPTYLPTATFLDHLASMRHDMRLCAEHVRGQLPVSLQPTALPASLSVVAEAGCGTCGSADSHADHASCEQDVQFTVEQLVCELCHAALVERRYPAESAADLGLAAELASVVAGFGVFSANGALRRRSLPVRVWGYALALQAWVRGEANGQWVPYLNSDATLHYRAGWQYLQRTGDSVFTRLALVPPPEPPSVESLIDELRRGSPSRRVTAIWELAHRKSIPAVPRLLECAQDRDSQVRAESLSALGAVGVGTPEVMEQLSDSLHDPREPVRAAAAAALGHLGNLSEDLLQELAETVFDPSSTVSSAAVEAIARIGPAAKTAVPHLLQTLRAALVACNDQRAARAARAIDKIVPDVRASIQQFLDHEQDLQHAAMDLMEQLNLKPTAPAESV